jgi:hypothetical protein
MGKSVSYKLASLILMEQTAQAISDQATDVKILREDDSYLLCYKLNGKSYMELLEEEPAGCFQRYIAGRLILEGYMLVTYNENYEVINTLTGDNYTITDDECSCPGFMYTNKGKERCKHVIFKDHMVQLSRLAELAKCTH